MSSTKSESGQGNGDDDGSSDDEDHGDEDGETGESMEETESPSSGSGDKSHDSVSFFQYCTAVLYYVLFSVDCVTFM